MGIKNQYVFYFPSLEETVLIEEPLSFQITRVLRLRPGDRILLCDGKGSQGIYCILGLSESEVRVRQEKLHRRPARSPLILLLGLLKKDNTEWVIQKAAELGAERVWIFQGENSVAKMKDPPSKLERWRKIALEALEQSVGYYLMEVEFFSSLEAALKKLESSGIKVLAVGGWAKQTLLDFPLTGPWGIVVGPEGGFSRREEALLAAKTAGSAKLAPGILRAETAALTALAQANLIRMMVGKEKF